METTENEFASRLHLPCRYLRCKEMFYDAAESDDFASGLHWCGRTQESFGPDGQPAGKDACQSGRPCHKA